MVNAVNDWNIGHATGKRCKWNCAGGWKERFPLRALSIDIFDVLSVLSISLSTYSYLSPSLSLLLFYPFSLPFIPLWVFFLSYLSPASMAPYIFVVPTTGCSINIATVIALECNKTVRFDTVIESRRKLKYNARFPRLSSCFRFEFNPIFFNQFNLFNQSKIMEICISRPLFVSNQFWKDYNNKTK